MLARTNSRRPHKNLTSDPQTACCLHRGGDDSIHSSGESGRSRACSGPNLFLDQFSLFWGLCDLISVHLFWAPGLIDFESVTSHLTSVSSLRLEVNPGPSPSPHLCFFTTLPPLRCLRSVSLLCCPRFSWRRILGERRRHPSRLRRVRCRRRALNRYARSFSSVPAERRSTSNPNVRCCRI